MLPVRLEVCNFLAYHKPDPINFEGLGLACLSGPNGAGKSSLLDAITWALWKRARAREDDKLLHVGQEEMYVIFDFRQDQTLYRVVRKYSRKGRGQSNLDLFTWDSDHWQSIGNGSVRETQQQINTLLRLDYETFVNSAFVQQGRADSFTVRTPAQRKAILAEILGLAQWEAYEARAKERLHALDIELNVNQAGIVEMEREEAREPEIRAALEAATQAAEAARLALLEAEAHYQEVADVPIRLEALESRWKSGQRVIEHLQEDLRAIERELAALGREHERCNHLIADYATIEDGFARLEAARRLVEDMDERRDHYTELERQRAEQQRLLDVARAELETQVRALRKQVQQAEKEAASGEAAEAELAQTRAELDALETRKAEREHILSIQQALSEESAALRTRNEGLRAEIDDLKRRLDVLEGTQEALCPVCHQPLTAAQRDELTAQYRAEGTERADAYRDNKRRLTEIATETKRHEAILKEIDAELRRYDRLKALEGTLVERLTKVRQVLERLADQRAELEARERALAEEAFGLEYQAELARLEDAMAQSGYDRAARDQARAEVKALEGFAEQRRELREAQQKLPEVEAALQEVRARHEQRCARLAEEQENIRALEQEIAALSVRAQEAQQRLALLNEQRAAAHKAVEERIAREQELHAVAMARTRKQGLLRRRDELREEVGIYEQLREAFGKNGVPAMIIEAAIPELEETTNELLARMTDGRMHIRLDTQREKKSGGVIETLDILISDELGTRDYDMFSGGESFRINFALRIALSQFLAHRAGARLQTLVIDEGFGSQDNVGRERLLESINAIRSDFDLILIVTHIDELRDAFPAHIEVRKTPGGSVIAVR